MMESLHQWTVPNFSAAQAQFLAAAGPPLTAFGLWLTGVQTTFTSTFTLTFPRWVRATRKDPEEIRSS
jgi:hypothetical protein